MRPVPYVADYSATEFSKHASQVLDMAGQGAVRVKRRNEVFVLLRERHLDQIVADAQDNRPKTLEDMLQGYNADQMKAGMTGWLEDIPAGKETL